MRKSWLGAIAVTAALVFSACGGTASPTSPAAPAASGAASPAAAAASGAASPAAAAASGAASPAAAAASGAASPGRLRLCVVHNNADHPSIQSGIKGFQDEAKFYPVDISFFDPALDPQKQVSMIMDCVAQKFDVILVNAVDPAAVVPALKAAHDAGIPVIMHNADTNDAGHAYSATFVTTDTYAQGEAVGQAIKTVMPQGAKMVIISGIPGQSGVAERINGAKDAVKDTGITFVDTQSANWQKDKALQVMQAFLTKYPDIQGVYALDDEMALGALQAITAAGKQDQVKVFGVNGEKAVCDLIKAGQFGGTALQSTYMVGVDSVRAAWDVTHNRVVPNPWLVPTIGLTKNNIDQYASLCW
jgi:ribose transport system substrate-binding protein